MVKYALMVLSKAIITNIRNGNYKKISTKKWFKHKLNMDLYFLENILDSTTDYAKINKVFIFSNANISILKYIIIN